MHPAPFAYLRRVDVRCLLLKLTELLKHRRAFLLAVALCRIFLERCCQGVTVTSLKENKVFWNLSRLVLFQSEVNAVFPRNSLKVLDVLIGNFNIGYTLVLPHELLHALLSARLNRTGTGFLCFLLLAVGKILGDCRFQNIGGHSCGADSQRDCSVFNFFLQ